MRAFNLTCYNITFPAFFFKNKQNQNFVTLLSMLVFYNILVLLIKTK